MALDRALEALAAADVRKSRVIELRFFGGLSVEETAEVLHVSHDTIKRDWRLAKLWLLRELEGEDAVTDARAPAACGRSCATRRWTATRASARRSWRPRAATMRALRQEVEALLAHAQSAEGFLAAPIGAVAAMSRRRRDRRWWAGTIGAYQIRVASRRGRHGRGLPRARHQAGTRRRDQGPCRRAFTSDPERLARFEREARMLASLNHPHIGAIYGVEDAAGVRALVLELVEGPTLAERLSAGPLSVAEALSIARQIAEALDAAHEKGIVHRDLKPANIKVTPDGIVKVSTSGWRKPGPRG